MKIAITGGQGFIGQAVSRLAKAQGHEVIVFDRRHGNDIMGPLGGLSGADCVIHLAGVLGTHELFDTVQDAIDINITGSHRIMSWCIEHDAHYVGILMPDVFPSIYTATKVACQRLASALHHSRNLRVSHVRAFNVFGPGQAYGVGHPQKLVPTAAVAGWHNVPIPVWGTGDQTVDLIYVDDVAKILLAATRYDDNVVIDAGTGIALSVNAVADSIIGITGSKFGIHHHPMRDGEIPTKLVSNHDGWNLLRPDEIPRLNLEDMVNTVIFYRDFPL